MHPDTQIRLLNLFDKLSDELSIQFVVSTHSLSVLKETIKKENKNGIDYKVVYIKNSMAPYVSDSHSYELLEADMFGSLSFDKPKVRMYFEDPVGKEYIEAMPKQERKKYGQFFTSAETARYMAQMFDIPESKDELSILDAGAGSGILTCALIERLIEMDTINHIRITCYENDENVLPILEQNLHLYDAIGKDITWEIRNDNYILSHILTTFSIFKSKEKPRKHKFFGVCCFEYVLVSYLFDKISSFIFRVHSFFCVILVSYSGINKPLLSYHFSISFTTLT